jgi:ankyrin repeat protein
VQGSHLKVLQYLAEMRASVNKSVKNGWTPLMFAAMRGSTSITKFLSEDVRANVEKKASLPPDQGAHDQAPTRWGSQNKLKHQQTQGQEHAAHRPSEGITHPRPIKISRFGHTPNLR